MASILKRMLTASCCLLALSIPSYAASKTYSNVEVTLYGWPDNSPPGNTIAYPKNGGNPTHHNVATTGGSHSSPGTFASDAQDGEFKVGAIIYVPSVKKYFILEDECVQCESDWQSGHHRHVDLWIGGNPPANANDVINCEDQLTTTESIILNPPSTESVSSKPLYNSSTNTCY